MLLRMARVERHRETVADSGRLPPLVEKARYSALKSGENERKCLIGCPSQVKKMIGCPLGWPFIQQMLMMCPLQQEH